LGYLNVTESKTSPPLILDPDLAARLTALAARSGQSLADLAQSVLRAHADEQEKVESELAEDEQRWQRYLAGGQTIAFQSVRGRLQKLAAEAARKAEPQ
jgi:hypothetical protein